jgi:hypothetical protein
MAGKKRRVAKGEMIGSTSGGIVPLQPNVVQVEFPIGEIQPDAYVFRHVELQLTPEQGLALRRVYNALEPSGKRLKSGRHVRSAAGAVQYMLEAIGDAVL